MAAIAAANDALANLAAVAQSRSRAVMPPSTPAAVLDAWLPPYYDPRGDPNSGYPSGAIMFTNIVTGQKLVTLNRNRYFKDGYPLYVIGAGPIGLRGVGEPGIMGEGSYTQDCASLSLTFDDAELIARLGGPPDNIELHIPGFSAIPANRWEGIGARTKFWFDYLPCGFESRYFPGLPRAEIGEEANLGIVLCNMTTLDRPCVDPVGVQR
jgi:hypothetical protein